MNVFALFETRVAEALGRLADRDIDAVVYPGEVEAVTVEVLSRWVHDALRAAIAGAGATGLAVRVWESDTAFGGYRGPV